MSLAVLLYLALRTPTTDTTPRVEGHRDPITSADEPVDPRPALDKRVTPVPAKPPTKAASRAEPASPRPRSAKAPPKTKAPVAGRRVVTVQRAVHANAAGGDETEAEDTAPDEQQFVYSPDREGIRAAVQDARVQIAECYSGWAKADTAGELVGRASIRFAITPPDDPDATELARLRDVTIDESTRGLPKHGFLDGCIINAFESLRFDPPTGTMNVTYPIDFAQE